MSVDVPTINEGQTANSDWRDSLVARAKQVVSHLATREKAKNPMIPDNFLDFSEAGFPANLVVIPVQIPRQGNPAEMAQYQDRLNRQWLHLPWSVISKNGGLDGKANVPGAYKQDLGNGQFVAAVAGNYLMYADKEQFENRRKANIDKAADGLRYKTESTEGGVRRDFQEGGTMSIEELFEYEKQIGAEAPIEGIRIER